jgi:hypothetical protein
MSVTARFYVNEVTRRAHGNTWNVGLQAVSRGEHNKEWAHYTPAGTMTLSIHPDSAAGQWFNDRLGKEVSILIEAAPEDE